MKTTETLAPGRLGGHEEMPRIGTTTTAWSVSVLDWPEQAEEADVLARAGRLRLLMVAPGVQPPTDWDLTSDWIRRPADTRDVLARIETLQRRAEHLHPHLHLDPDGLLWLGSNWVALAPVEVGLMTVLAGNIQRVVSRAELLAAGWPDGSRGGRTLDARLQRLRTRVESLGLEIANVRQRGFVLTFAARP